MISAETGIRFPSLHFFLNSSFVGLNIAPRFLRRLACPSPSDDPPLARGVGGLSSPIPGRVRRWKQNSHGIGHAPGLPAAADVALSSRALGDGQSAGRTGQRQRHQNISTAACGRFMRVFVRQIPGRCQPEHRGPAERRHGARRFSTAGAFSADCRRKLRDRAVRTARNKGFASEGLFSGLPSHRCHILAHETKPHRSGDAPPRLLDGCSSATCIRRETALEENRLQDIALSQARALFNQVVDVRDWNARARGRLRPDHREDPAEPLARGVRTATRPPSRAGTSRC